MQDEDIKTILYDVEPLTHGYKNSIKNANALERESENYYRLFCLGFLFPAVWLGIVCLTAPQTAAAKKTKRISLILLLLRSMLDIALISGAIFLLVTYLGVQIRSTPLDAQDIIQTYIDMMNIYIQKATTKLH
jgi:hypothetical protein